MKALLLYQKPCHIPRGTPQIQLDAFANDVNDNDETSWLLPLSDLMSLLLIFVCAY